MAAEQRANSLEQSAKAERAKWEEWKAQASQRLEHTRGGGAEREAQLSLRVKQMELAVQSAAAAADEAHKREQAQAELVKNLQMRYEQAAQAAAMAGSKKGSNDGVMAAMKSVQAHAEALQHELNSTQSALQRERYQAQEMQKQHSNALAEALNNGVMARGEAERMSERAKHELSMSQQAAKEVRLQADLLKSRMAAQLSAEQKRAEAREATLSQQREQTAQALAMERAAHAATTREAEQKVAHAEETVRAAQAKVQSREADAAVANTARWASQQLVSQEQQRSSRLEKQIYELEKDIRKERNELKTIKQTHAAELKAAKAGRPPPQQTLTADQLLEGDDLLIPGLGTPATGGRGAASEALDRSRPKPKPPSGPRPTSLPDYRQQYGGSLSSRSSFEGRSGGGGGIYDKSGGQNRNMGALASGIQNLTQPGGVVARVGRLIASRSFGSSKSRRERDVALARERASMRRGRNGDEDTMTGLAGRESYEDEDEHSEGEMDDVSRRRPSTAPTAPVHSSHPLLFSCAQDGGGTKAIRGRSASFPHRSSRPGAQVTPTRQSFGQSILRTLGLGGKTPPSSGRPTPRRVF